MKRKYEKNHKTKKIVKRLRNKIICLNYIHLGIFGKH